jgi:hypothetical protein
VRTTCAAEKRVWDQVERKPREIVCVLSRPENSKVWCSAACRAVLPDCFVANSVLLLSAGRELGGFRGVSRPL